jgi:hypothetical protein
MMIDIAYIRQALQLPDTLLDSTITYLIKHYYEYLVEMMNLDTTMDKEGISTEIVKDNTIPEDALIDSKLTVFQQTLILGIACNLSNMQISVRDISDTEYNYFIKLIDLTNIKLNKEGTKYILDWCILYNSYLAILKSFSTDYSTVDYIRRLFNLDPELITDSQIEFLLDHYTNLLKDKLGGKADLESATFKEVVYLGIACQLFKTNPTAIISPKEYEVGDVSETFDTSFTKSADTWCDMYDDALNDLIADSEGFHGFKAFGRGSAREKYGYYGPQ